jgi:hypothetical protein
MSMIIDGTNGLTFNNATTQASAGSVLQVVNASYTSSFSTSSSTYVASGLTASITPKFSTSKILVIASMAYQAAASANANITLYRNSTNLGNSNTGFGYMTTAVNTIPCITYLDSPATTSSTTYTIYTKTSAGTVYINTGAETSTITLMEIAA